MSYTTPDLTSAPYSRAIHELIDAYKNDVKVNGIADELYKFKLITRFQSTWNIEASDFGSMIKGLDFGNLLFHIARATLNHMAKDKPEELRNAFRLLYDEAREVKQRVPEFLAILKTIYDGIKGKEEFNLGQDERSVSVFLAFRFPDKYFLYKTAFTRPSVRSLI
jgi:5-methylcytosine-specific restriction protein B